jgi:hypothetical protein
VRPTQIEVWCLSIVDRVLAGQPIEDARVEVKAEWPAPDKAARRIAGHANAARGEPVLWVIGLDEKARAVTGAAGPDTATWLPQVFAFFDGVTPDVTHLAVPTDAGGTVVALLVDSGRAPFVVRNAVFGQAGAGPVEREVPWREGTAVRSAKRSELLRVLTPSLALPTVELMNASLRVRYEDDAGRILQDTSGATRLAWKAWFDVFLTPVGSERVVLPLHRTRGLLQIPFLRGDLYLVNFEIRPFEGFKGIAAKPNPFVTVTAGETSIAGPAALSISASRLTKPVEIDPGVDIRCRLSLSPVGAERVVELDATFVRTRTQLNEAARWNTLPI